MQRLFRFLLRSFWILLALVTLALSLGPMAGYWSDRNWQCELATHFQLHYVVLLAMIAIVFALDGRFRWATFALVVSVAAFCYHILPLYFGPAPVAAPRRTLRLMSANLAYFNPTKEAFLDLVKEEKPDVMLLLEVNQAWSALLDQLNTEYPHRKEVAHETHEGVAVLSKLAFNDMRIDTVGQAPSNVAVGSLQLPDGKSLTLVGVHPDPPITWRSTLRRNDQLVGLAKLVVGLSQPLVLAGDLNTSSWNPAFKQLLFSTGLRDSRLGFGIQPTWNRLWPLVRTPIDHCLVSAQVHVLDRHTGPAFGSDHLPVIVDLQVP